MWPDIQPDMRPGTQPAPCSWVAICYQDFPHFPYLKCKVANGFLPLFTHCFLEVIHNTGMCSIKIYPGAILSFFPLLEIVSEVGGGVGWEKKYRESIGDPQIEVSAIFQLPCRPQWMEHSRTIKKVQFRSVRNHKSTMPLLLFYQGALWRSGSNAVL